MRALYFKCSDINFICDSDIYFICKTELIYSIIGLYHNKRGNLMNYKVCGNDIVLIQSDFDLDETLDCGQAFR